jgi:hypothetical protein
MQIIIHRIMGFEASGCTQCKKKGEQKFGSVLRMLRMKLTSSAAENPIFEI